MSDPVSLWRIHAVTVDDDVTPSLEARVRDPAWMLCRQWQLGEFQGEDAGSPFSVSVGHREATLAANSPSPAAARSVGVAPLALQLHGQRRPLDVRFRAELGRLFARTAGSLPIPADFCRFERKSADAIDALPAAEAAFWRIVGGRAFDGAQLLTISTGSLSSALVKVLAIFRDAVKTRFGDAGETDTPPGWQSTTLAQRAAARAPLPLVNEPARLDAVPGERGETDWYSFDVFGEPDDHSRSAASSTTLVTRPARVQIPGAPAARWWDFEDSARSLIGLKADATGIGRALLADFLLVHSVDWFVVPLTLTRGQISWIETVLVTDVFGVRTSVWSAEAVDRYIGRSGWSLFRNASSSGRDPGGFLVVGPGLEAAELVGAPLEDLRLRRDEGANLVWAIGRVLPDGLGRAAQPRTAFVAGATVEDAKPEGALRYRDRTPVPEGWTPYLPETEDVWTGAMHLHRAVLADAGPASEATTNGLVLGVVGDVIREDAVPRGGRRLVRAPVRVRAPDGNVHVWVRWSTGLAEGEASSGLRWDVVDPE